MEKTSQPNPPQEANEALRALEARLSLLERQVTEQSRHSEGATGRDRPLGRADLSAELKHHRDQLRDYEKALVERIADVDDDRRATASRLQRAWQTQREEIDERLRRHAGLLAGTLLLFLIVVSVAVFVVYRQAATGRQQIAAEVSALQTQLAGVSSGGMIDVQAREELDRLTAELGEITTAIGGADQNGKRAVQASLAAERSARQQTEETLANEIQRLGEGQRRLALDLASLRSTLTTSEASRAGEPVDAAAPLSTSPTTAVAPTPGPEPGAVPEAASEDSGNEGEEGSSVSEMGEGSRIKAERDADLAPEESDAVASVADKTLVAGGDIYALQLIGFFSRKSFDEFAARDALPAKVYLLRQTYKGRPWYALIYGLYDDHAAAEEALSGLPADLVALKPWIRPIPKLTELRIIKTGRESEKQSVPDRE